MFSKGKKQGNGINYQKANESKFLGNFKNDKPEGLGIFSWDNHDEFIEIVGEFIGGVLNGPG